MKDKIVLITGATSGIGRATAVEFAKRGAKLILTGRREDEGRNTVDMVDKAGSEAYFCRTDISVEEDCKKMVEFALEKFGRLDCAFNNAGTEGRGGPITEVTNENFHKVINTNVLGVLNSMKYEIPAMLKTGGGSIVNNGSVASVVGMAGGAVYFASKHAVAGLTKVAAVEWGSKGIRVNTVSPAAIETDMLTRFAGGPEGVEALTAYHPIGRIGKPSEIATAVAFLCSDDASFVTGTNLMVDGAFTAQ